MSDITWIKLKTEMFSDDKIKLIESMPEADAIIVIWVKLLTQAGKTNANGYIFLNQNEPLTDEMLSTIFNRPVNTVRLALKILSDFGMIVIDDKGFILIENWEKHQNIEGMNKAGEQSKLRMRKSRTRAKLLEEGYSPSEAERILAEVDLSSVTDVAQQLQHLLQNVQNEDELIKVEEKDDESRNKNRENSLKTKAVAQQLRNVTLQNKNKNKNNNIYTVFDHWNSKEIISHKNLTDKIKRKINGCLKEHSAKEILRSIDNYKLIIESDEYYFDHKWILKDFLQRGLEKFMNLETAKNNYAVKNNGFKNRSNTVNPIPASHQML